MSCRFQPFSRFSLFALLLGLAAVGIAGSAMGQACPWDGAAMCDPSGAPPYSMCDRNLGSPGSCQAPSNNGNGTICGPAASNTMVFGFSATQTNVAFRNSAFCRWQCTTTIGPTMVNCRIDLLDGLPVELMDFSVGFDDSDEGEDDSFDDTDGENGAE